MGKSCVLLVDLVFISSFTTFLIFLVPIASPFSKYWDALELERITWDSRLV